MANFVFNVAKGRVNELVNRVATNDPANSALILVPIDAGATSDATLEDLDTLSAVLGSVTERTIGGWNRKTITAATMTVDDANNRNASDFGDQTWTAVSSGAVTDLLVCYDADTTAGTDADIIPLTCHDFTITPDGSDVIATVADFFRAT